MKSEMLKLDQIFQTDKTRQKTDLTNVRFDELVSAVFSAGPSYYYVIDFFDKKLLYVSSSIKQIHGLDPNNVTYKNILSFIHPDDVDFVRKADLKAFEMFNQMGMGKYLKYKVSYSFRLKMLNDDYRLFLHQSIMLAFDADQVLYRTFNIHTDISHIVSESNNKLSLIGLIGEPSFTDINVSSRQVSVKDCIIYSSKEIETLRFISEGYTNNEIARKLDITLETVKKYRRNILEKAKVKNTAQLIKKSIQEGLI